MQVVYALYTERAAKQQNSFVWMGTLPARVKRASGSWPLLGRFAKHAFSPLCKSDERK
nr:hypothetical protein [uncultured Campylobacter sp.]